MKRQRQAPKPKAPAAPSAADLSAASGGAAVFWRLMPLWAALVTIAVFLPSLGNGWVTWDDADNFLNNRAFRGLGAAQLKWIFSGSFGFMGNYEPVTWLSHALTFLASGLEPKGYHLAGLLLHAAATALFCLTAERLLRKAVPAAEDEPAWALPLASGAAALFFSLHPLRVEVVAWISAQHHAMAAVFILLAVLSYLRACEAAKAGGKPWPWRLASLAGYALSLLCIPIGITLPAALLILDYYPLRRQGRGLGALLWEKAPYFVLAAGDYWIATAARRAVGDLQALPNMDLGSRVFQIPYCVLVYLGHIAAPFHLSPIYGLPDGASSANPVTLGAMAAVAGATAAFFYFRRRWPAGLAAWAFYLIALAPALALSQKFEQFTADRYTYFSSLGWALLAGGALLAAARSAPAVRTRNLSAALLLSLGLLGGMAALTRRQLWVWHDAHTIWLHVLELNPNLATAHNNLGAQLSFEGQKEEAVEHFRAALKINPNFVEARNNLGETLGELGQWGEALQAFEDALKVNPKNLKTRLNLGMELRRQNRLQESALQYEEALRLDPNNAEAHAGLGATLAMGRQYGEAERQFRAALAVNPRMTRAENYWGNALRMQGRLDEAIAHYAASARLSPKFSDAELNWAETLRQQGKHQDSVEHYRRALELKPGSVDLINKLASALAATGGLDEAAQLYGMLLQARPGDAEARRNLDAVWARQGKK